MAGQNAYTEIDYSLFDVDVRSSAAPARKMPEDEERPELRVVGDSNSKFGAFWNRLNLSYQQGIAVLCVIALFAVAGFGYVNAYVEYYSLNAQTAELQENIELVKSENVRLTNELNSTYSVDNVLSYAENVLGMVRLENYQVNYIDFTAGDSVTVSGSRTVKKTEQDEPDTNVSVILGNLLSYFE